MNVNNQIRQLVEHTLKMAYIDHAVSGRTSAEIITEQTNALFKALTENNLEITESTNAT